MTAALMGISVTLLKMCGFRLRSTINRIGTGYKRMVLT
jgi:outer membrane lipopolysaccharide assembly protein LptE/RlpB